ncbi:MAG TPA: hypothetical protein VFM74_02740 [Candidatus Limnocylindria bacterium]|nr:hypothetical protein [Candidatus Limnocylindria bacterium]
MSTDQLLVDLGDVQGHASVERSDAQPFIDLLKRRPAGDRIAIRLSPIDDADDVEGHAQSTSVTVLAGPADDDVEGHSISLRFPTAREADTFRRNLMAAGALTGAIVVSGAAIALRPAAPATSSTSAVVDRPAAVVEMQQQAQYSREQRLMEVAPATSVDATTTAPTGAALAGQQQAQQQRDQALGGAGSSSGGGDTAADDLPTHGGVIP